MNEHECGKLVELYGCGKTEVLGKKRIPVPLCPHNPMVKPGLLD
jgi:hypothetical protein